MENSIVNRYMRLIEPLTLETKLELISKILENLKSGITVKPASNKEELLEALYGAWSDTDNAMADDIISSRMTSDKDINLD
ncbi:MAG: hypothetical protein SFU99_21240 [Saprospiraceae bacterium]|nr:hypothetical protein [Saprospiraceae bacterium]